jgi:hypothetical protein
MTQESSRRGLVDSKGYIGFVLVRFGSFGVIGRNARLKLGFVRVRFEAAISRVFEGYRSLNVLLTCFGFVSRTRLANTPKIVCNPMWQWMLRVWVRLSARIRGPPGVPRREVQL